MPATKVLIVGAGRGGRTLIELFHNDPNVEIIGVADLRPQIAGMQLARSLGIPTSINFREFLHHPAPDLIMDVTGNPEVQEQLRTLKAPESEVVGGIAARLMWALINERKQKKLLEEKYRMMLHELESHPENEFIVGKNKKMIEIGELVLKVAPTTATVLIRGETGTGKEIIARAIHYHSNRKDEPLVVVNCTAFSPHLIESELFGHKRGAFTGAVADKMGLLEKADGGTVFLDEIGDMPLEMQTKLLRFLQTNEIRALGDVTTKTVDVRIVAATNRDLEVAIKEGTFRADLFYRLNTFTITLPPLRERREDIPLYAYHLLKLAVAKVNKKVDGIAPDATAYLMSYDWPGNLRELQGVMERAVILCMGSLIEKEHLPLTLQDNEVAPSLEEGLTAARANVVEKFERRAIIKFLTDCNGNVTRAAQKAGIPRRSFYRMMEKLGIQRESFLKSREHEG